MNVRFAALAGVCIAATLVACNGTAPTGGFAAPTAPPTLTPTTPPTVGPGSTFSYAGTLNQATTYNYPQPSPFPSTAAAAQVTYNVAVSTSPPPAGLGPVPGTALDYKATETDAFPLQSSVTTTDSWEGNVTAGSAVNLVQYATNAVTNANTATASTIGTSFTAPQILNQTPSTNGASWTNTNGGTVNEVDADGSTDVTTRNANGTYTDTQTVANTPLTLTIGVNADGSGTYGGTYLSGQYGIQAIQYSAPAAGKIVVQAVLVPPATPAPPATPPPTPAPIVLGTPPAWFTSGAPLYSDKTVVATNVSFPGSCNVPAQFGSSGSSLTRKISSYDPVLGFTDVQTLVTYVASAGVVCQTLNDLQTTYYDYLNDTQASYYDFAAFVGTPLALSTIAETLTLQSTSTASSQFRSSSQSAAVRGTALSPAGLAFATAQFEARVAHAREVRRKAAVARLIRFVHTHSFGGRER